MNSYAPQRLVLAAVSGLFLSASALVSPAAPAPVVVKDASAFGFPDFLTSLNATTRGWMFAPPLVGMKWVELNGVLLSGNGGTNDPESGLTLTGAPTNYIVSGFDWTDTPQRPARNGLCRGGLHGNKQAFSLKFNATRGHTYVIDVLALGAAAQKRVFDVAVDGQSVVRNWTVLTDKAANRLLRFQATADGDSLDLQFAPGSAPGADTNPAITAVAITDLAEGIWQHDPIFGRVPLGMVNIAALGTPSSPDGLDQDGDGKGDLAAIDGNPATYWDEQDGAKLYRYALTFGQPEKISALAIMGWAQHDFAPKDFEVLCDGKPVKKVENAAYAKNIFHLALPETTCRSMELRITGYYGRSPAIRELGIFSREPHALPIKAAAAPTPAVPKDGGPIFGEWPVIYKEKNLLVYAAGKFKPYVKELRTIKGRNVLRDAPYDHLHHHGLMYAIRANGVNFWEETPGCGFQKPIETSKWAQGANPDGRPQFTLRQTLHWLAAADVAAADTAKAAILIEQRTLTLTVNEGQNEVALQWKSEFEVGPKTNVVTLAGANYHGLGMRFQKDLDPLAKHLNAGGPPDLNGRQDVSRHPWGSVSFDQPGQPATLVLFGHPSNARGDSWYFTMNNPFAYLSATQNLDKETLVYRQGDKFQLNYLVAVYPAVVSAETIQARGQSWASAKP